MKPVLCFLSLTSPWLLHPESIHLSFCHSLLSFGDLVSFTPTLLLLLCPRLFLIGKRGDGRRTSAPLSLAALWWGKESAAVGLSLLFPLSISNPAAFPNTHQHPGTHTSSLTHTCTSRHFSLNWELQCVQSKDEGKNTGVARGERRTLQGEFDFHLVLTYTHSCTNTYVLLKPSQQALACWVTSKQPLKYVHTLTDTHTRYFTCVSASTYTNTHTVLSYTYLWILLLTEDHL